MKAADIIKKKGKAKNGGKKTSLVDWISTRRGKAKKSSYKKGDEDDEE